MIKNFIGSRALPELKYHRPAGMDELLKMLGEFKGNFKIVAGCTDFIPAIRRGTWFFENGLNLIDIKGVKELNFIKKEGDHISMGAATTLTDIVNSPVIREYAPMLVEAVSKMASPQVRNIATVGGNLCMASPAGDTSPPLLTLDAQVEIKGPDREEMVPLTKFFLGPGTTCMTPRDLLTKIRFPVMQKGEAGHSTRMGLRDAFVCSIISVSVWVKVEDGVFRKVKIAQGAVAPTPVRIAKAEEYLEGKEVTEENIEKAAHIASDEIRPITDLRASAEYRKDLSKTLTKRMLLLCAQDIAG